jgi:hypothetical protein
VGSGEAVLDDIYMTVYRLWRHGLRAIFASRKAVGRAQGRQGLSAEKSFNRPSVTWPPGRERRASSSAQTVQPLTHASAWNCFSNGGSVTLAV